MACWLYIHEVFRVNFVGNVTLLKTVSGSAVVNSSFLLVFIFVFI